MNNLQELFDAYIRTQPSAEKIRAATSMMIHISKALNVTNQEEITSDYFREIPSALAEFFVKSPQRAILDKAILAEMIGRIGPKTGLRIILEELLKDEDENVRLYTLQSLEYYGTRKPKSILPFVERFRVSDEPNVLATAASLTAKMICAKRYKVVLDQVKKWYGEKEYEFVTEVVQQYIQLASHGSCNNDAFGLDELKHWLNKNCRKVATQIFTPEKE